MKVRKVDEKRQIPNFLFSHLEMKDKKAVITLRLAVRRLVAVSRSSQMLGRLDAFRTFNWEKMFKNWPYVI